LGAVLSVILMASCSDGEYKPVGGRDFDYERTSTIQAGTSTATLIAALGQPVKRSALADGSEEWRYELLLERTSGISFGIHITVSHQRRKQEAVFIIRNGLVVAAHVDDQLL